MDKLRRLQLENMALKESLQYLVDTKKRKDTIGKDSLYLTRKRIGWQKATKLLNDLNQNEVLFENLRTELQLAAISIFPNGDQKQLGKLIDNYINNHERNNIQIKQVVEE